MKITTNTYKFIGKVLPDGHLSLPDEVAKGSIKEFEVTMAPVDHVKETIALYLESGIEKKGKLADISLDSDAIEKAVKNAFGTANIDDIIESIRK
ncbi:MAG: hypothetical protein AABZ10_09275 [Nitrospirota bacterium]